MAALHYLARRANWQLQANQDGSLAEAAVIKVLKSYLDSVYPGEYEVCARPPWFGQPFLEMDYEDNPELYTKPEVPVKGNVWFDTERNLFMKHNGKREETIKETFVPDTGIRHIPSGRRYAIECKKQQAKGNAHERACKYTTPSMIDFMKKKLEVDYHPVGYVFSGGIVEHEGYCREIRAFFKFARGHLLLWKENRSPILLTNWLESTVLPLLRGSPSQSE
jgi:hypothetical protein